MKVEANENIDSKSIIILYKISFALYRCECWKLLMFKAVYIMKKIYADFGTRRMLPLEFLYRID